MWSLTSMATWLPKHLVAVMGQEVWIANSRHWDSSFAVDKTFQFVHGPCPAEQPIMTCSCRRDAPTTLPLWGYSNVNSSSTYYPYPTTLEPHHVAGLKLCMASIIPFATILRCGGGTPRPTSVPLNWPYSILIGNEMLSVLLGFA